MFKVIFNYKVKVGVRGGVREGGSCLIRLEDKTREICIYSKR